MEKVAKKEKETENSDEGKSPSVTVKQLTFSDGTVVSLNSDDIVVFVGPNNAGKSAALREIEAHFGHKNTPNQVILAMETQRHGTLAELEQAFINNSQKLYPNGALHYSGSGYNISADHLAVGWSSRIDLLQKFFCRRLKTETRITDSNPSDSFKVLSEAATRPIQMMYADSEVERRLSKYFKAAFNSDLIVMKAGGSEIPLLVGERLPLLPGEDPTTKSYLERLMKSAVSLREQGDGMRSFASVVLEMLASKTPSMLLLDEPEAFLHPPQARLLGEFLARERRTNAQMFIATHSPDVLLGLLNVAPQQLRVIRIQRAGNANQVKELEKAKAKEISADPLMKYSSVLSGVFHRRSIICEADADCLFYQALLSQKTVHDGPHPDVLFLHASGKHRMATMAGALRALGVPVDVIADIDLLSEQDSFQKLVEVMSGDWSTIENDWKGVKSAVESRKPWLNTDAVKGEIEIAFAGLDGQGKFPEAAAAKIKSTLKKSSPWGALKEAGDAAIPGGQPSQQMQKIRSYLESIGIWIVPVGELEGFCKAIGGHGPKWVQGVIEERDLAAAPDLEEARKFVRSIWGRHPSNLTGVSNRIEP